MLSQSTNPIQAWLSSVAAAIRARLMHYDPRLPRTVAFLPASAETLHGMDTQRHAARPDEAQEVRQWLHEIQKRAILPLKWTIFVVAAAFWALGRPQFWPPPVEVFALFVLYFLANAGESYLLLFSRVAPRQIRPLCVVSYAVDVAFVACLVWFDSVRFARTSAAPTDFYILFFIVVLRSFVLFRSGWASLLVNGVIGLVFAATLLAQENTTPMDTFRNHAIRVVFFWIVILMSAFIAHLLHLQNKELMRARENLLRSENLALLGQLAAGVAHEVNNPIGIISAYAEYLKKRFPENDPHHEDLEAIHREAQRCKGIVEGLLDFARTAPPHVGPTDLAPLLSGTLSLIAHADTSQTPRIEQRLAPDLAPVLADANQLRQALLNLLLNAQQACGNTAGLITIEAENLPDEQAVRLTITDNGCGIAPEDLPHVFTPFFSRKPTGTGLGLAITRRIIEEHGGRIALRSEFGKGTSVEVILPAAVRLRTGKQSSGKLRRVGTGTETPPPSSQPSA
ncbi:Signal transduction histidine kinase [Candidatus Sumerlaea chitinivorans]|uniref:histidine kinase n=1 Tax=Sumerlaea chitinivorans TaxID=2250252 RepID=A0A2Z4Y600_SUMC1|nr:Signal transduction histidine kinase [Candidatus Sumerlaea chitinivorans]